MALYRHLDKTLRAFRIKWYIGPHRGYHYRMADFADCAQSGRNDFNIELGYLYHSPAIVAEYDDEAVHANPLETFGRPGSRAPHLWIEKDSKRVSTLDLFGPGFTLLAATEGAACDGFVAWRAKSSETKPQETLRGVLQRLGIVPIDVEIGGAALLALSR